MGVDRALLWRKLDALLDDSQLDKVELNLRVGTAMVAASVLSVGYVLWTLRGGYLLASLLAQLPVWAQFDPLPVLEFAAADKSRKREDDEDDHHVDVHGDSSLDELLDRFHTPESSRTS